MGYYSGFITRTKNTILYFTVVVFLFISQNGSLDLKPLDYVVQNPGVPYKL
jgi:hypothetical protein